MGKSNLDIDIEQLQSATTSGMHDQQSLHTMDGKRRQFQRVIGGTLELGQTPVS